MSSIPSVRGSSPAFREEPHKRGFSLDYFKRNDSSQEIEFLFERDGTVIPTEEKSKNGKTESLNKERSKKTI